MQALHATVHFIVFHVPTCKTNMLPVISKGSFTSGEEHGLMVVEGKVVRIIFDLRGSNRRTHKIL